MTASPPTVPFRFARIATLSLAAMLLAACADEQPRPKPQVPASTQAQPPARSSRKPWKPLGPYTPGGLYAPGVSDGAPDVPPDIATLPEPVPHAEPLAHYGNRSPYVVLGKTYTVLPSAAGYDERGVASWYGTKFDGRVTSSLEPYDLSQFTAAHRTLPLPSYARVTNLENGRSVIVRINDRGPFHDGRLIDLSYAAAIKLGVNVHGTAMVEVRGIDTGQPDSGSSTGMAAKKPAPARKVSISRPVEAAKPAPPPGLPRATLADTPAKHEAAPRPAVAASDADADGSAESSPNADDTAAPAGTPVATPPAAVPLPARAQATPTPAEAPANTAIATPSPAPAAAKAVASLPEEQDASPATNPSPAQQLGRPAIEPSTIGFLQVASYGDRGNAERMLQRLQQAGIEHAELVPVQVSDQQLWRVHIGPLRADEAASVAAHMDSLGFGSPPFFKQ